MNKADITSEQRKNVSVILIVDDQPKNLQLAASVLNAHYKLLLADSGPKAIKIATEKQPDLILLDVMMPGMSGYEVCKQLKDVPATANIPIIFLTAKSEEEDILKAFEVGGVDYVTKPFKAKEVLARIKTQIALRNAEKRLRQVIDLVPYRLFAKDSEGNVIMANNATASFHHTSVEELLGKPEPALPNGMQYIAPQENEAYQDATCEEKLQLSNGSAHFYQTTKLPFTFSGTDKPALLQLAVDVTALKEQQKEISALNDRLIQHNDYKDKMLSIIAHDLRGPLGGTVALLDLICKNQEKLSKEKIIHYAEKLKDNTSSSLELLNNLLLWTQSQFERVRFEPMPLPLKPELHTVLKPLRQQASQKGVHLHDEVPEGITLHADTDMLQTILRNLVSNAIKFTTPDKSIFITAQQQDGMASITVADQGIGIPDQNLQKLLKRTHENISTFGTNNEKGSGIGLNLCLDFVEKHGGKMTINSQEGKGSTFSFTIPIAQQV